MDLQKSMFVLKQRIRGLFIKHNLMSYLIEHNERKYFGPYKNEVVEDMHLTEREWSKIEYKKTTDTKGFKIFILNFTTLISQVKLDSVLANYLMHYGAEIYYVCTGKGSVGQQYLETFHINNIINLDKYTNYSQSRKYYDLAKTMCSNFEYSFIKQLKYKEYEVGRQVLATVSREDKYGGAKCNLQKISYKVLQLMAMGMMQYDTMLKIVDEYNPNQAIMNEMFYLTPSACASALLANGVAIVQYIAAPDRKSFIFKRRNSFENYTDHPMSIAKCTFNEILNEPIADDIGENVCQQIEKPYMEGTEINQNGKKIKQKKDVIQQLGLDEKKKNVVIYSHILWDANMFYGEDLYNDFEEWFIRTIKVAMENPNVNWIIKMHPANVWKGNSGNKCREEELIEENFGSLPDFMHCVKPDTDINTYSFFKITDIAVTVRGTIGMELPCLGIPVLTAGTGRYSGMGFTIDSNSIEEYEQHIRNIHRLQPLTDQQKVKAQLYYNTIKKRASHTFPGLVFSYNTRKRISYPFVTRLDIQIDNPKFFFDNDSVYQFCKWVMESNEVDFIL